MLSFVMIIALVLRFDRALALFPNSTSAYPPRPLVTKAPSGNCSNNCTYPRYKFDSITWFQKTILTTYTAETVLLIVNKSNRTRTTTISNTELDFGQIVTPTNTNSDGTVIASVVDHDGSTRTVAYPTTVYRDYDPDIIKWTGQLSTTVGGIPTCVIAPTGVVEVLPSHPLLPLGVQTTDVNTIDDPRGWTFVPLSGRTCDDPRNMIEGLFPELGVWSCQATGICLAYEGEFLGLVVLTTSLYLTKTSILSEQDDGPTLTEAPVSTTQSPVVHTEKTAPVPIPVVSLSSIPSATDMALPEASPFNAPSVSIFATPQVLSLADQLAPTETPSPIEESTSSSSPQNYNAPDTPKPASSILPIVSDPPSPASKSVIIVLPTSPSIASASVSLPTVISSANAQGAIVSSTAYLPAVVLTTTNAVGSKVLTTSLLSLPTLPASGPAPIIINSETITPNAHSQYIISGQTLSPDASITLGSGFSTTLLALQTSSGFTALVYGPRTSFLPSASGATPAPLTIGTNTITPNSNSQYIIAGSTLSAEGASITLSSGSSTTVLALQTSGSETALVYGPSTSSLTPIALPTTPPVITIGSDTITANSKTQYIIGSQTLTPNGAITISGTRVSLAAGESDLVIGSSTEALATYINAGLGNGPNGTGVQQVFAGGADKRRGWSKMERWLSWMAASGTTMWFLS